MCLPCSYICTYVYMYTPICNVCCLLLSSFRDGTASKYGYHVFAFDCRVLTCSSYIGRSMSIPIFGYMGASFCRSLVSGKHVPFTGQASTDAEMVVGNAQEVLQGRVCVCVCVQVNSRGDGYTCIFCCSLHEWIVHEPASLARLPSKLRCFKQRRRQL